VTYNYNVVFTMLCLHEVKWPLTKLSRQLLCTSLCSACCGKTSDGSLF